MKQEKINYDLKFEDLMIRYMITDPELYVRSKNIIDPQFFEDDKNKKAVEFFHTYSDKYAALPTPDEIHTFVGKKFEKLDGIQENNKQSYFDNIESFCRHRGLELAMYSSMDLLEKKNYGEVEKRIKAAVQISLVKDLGTDYFMDPATRIKTMLDKSAMVSTGWTSIDTKLRGGLERGTLNIVAGQSGAGKSIILQNLACNWVKMGFNVVYLSLELSEKLCSLRLDAMMSGMGTKDVVRNIDDVAIRLANIQKKSHGTLQVKQMPNGCNANDIKAYIKEYEIKTGRKVDAILLDYLDLCAPINKSISLSDHFVKDKYVSEDLRSMATELGTLFFTASQLNRGSHEEVEFGHQNISGGLSKINTADNVLAIYVTPAMKEAGRYQLQFMKTRSSDGVGSKVDMLYDPATMVISDMEDNAPSALGASTNQILDNLRRKNAASNSSITNNTAPIQIEHKTTPDVMSKGSMLRDLVKKK